MLTDPLHQIATVGAVDPDAPHLLAGSAQAINHEAHTCRVRNRCSGYDHRKQQAQSVHKETPPASVHVLALVKPHSPGA